MRLLAIFLLARFFLTPALAQPNVIIIFTDDLGYADAGCFGGTIPTPAIDQLAASGVMMTHFYTAQPVCSAARAALLTGCYPNRIGIHQALMPGSGKGLNPSEITIPDMLREKGYRTAIFGKWHLGDAPECMPLKQGFDEFRGIPYSNDMWPRHPQQGTVFNFKPLPFFRNERLVKYLKDQSGITRNITKNAVRFIRKNRNSPFFLYIAHPMPHVPLAVSGKFRGKSGIGLFGDVIMELDWSVGEVTRTLDKYNLRHNTLVIFTSDNGPWLAYGNHAGSAGVFREGKGTVWEGGVREPFIASLPGVIPAGTKVEVPAMAIDLLPSIAALTGAQLPEQTIDGVNILPVLKGDTLCNPHDALFFYYNVNELQAVQSGSWKLYFPHTYRSLKDGYAGKDGLPGEYTQIKVVSAELYNLADDPSEKTDLAGKYPEIVEKLSIKADKMREELGDSLRDVKGRSNRQPWIRKN